jgi:hypothetical protein
LAGIEEYVHSPKISEEVNRVAAAVILVSAPRVLEVSVVGEGGEMKKEMR